MTAIPQVSELLDLHGRRALVTGSSQGIGRSIAHRLAQAGASVILHGRTETTTLRELADELTSMPGGCGLVFADLSTSKGCATLMQEVKEQYGGLELLINNAADQGMAALCDFDPDSIAVMLATNLAAPMLLTRDFARQAKAGAAIVNICSLEAIRPAIGHSHYASAKAGLLQFTRAAALELGASGVRVNAVCPGLIDRPGLDQEWPEGIKSWVKMHPCTELALRMTSPMLFCFSPATPLNSLREVPSMWMVEWTVFLAGKGK